MILLKKQLLGVLLAVTFMVSAFGFSPTSVHAQAAGMVPVIDAGAIAELTYISGVKTEELTITSILNGLVWAAAGAVVQGLTRSLVNWINSGFEGSPAFATDIENELRNWTDGIVDRFIERVFANISRELEESLDGIGGGLNLPFRISIVNDARYSYYRKTSSNYFAERSRPTLGNCSGDPSAFLNGDFNQGGWSAWFCALEEPNNPFGFKRLVEGQLDSVVASGRQERQTEILIGDGYLGFRRCSGGGTQNSGTQSGGTTNLSTASKQTGPNCSIVTPGSYARDLAPESVRVAFDRLNLADSINEIVGALISQLVSQVFSSSGLLGLSQPSNGGRSFLESATDPSTQPGVNTNNNTNNNGGSSTTTNDYTREETEDFRDNWQKIKQAADAAHGTITSLIGCFQTNSIALGILQIPGLEDQLDEIEEIQTQANQRIAQATAVLNALDVARETAEESNAPEVVVPGISQTLIAAAHVEASSNPELGNTTYRMLVNWEDEAAEDLLVCQD